MSTPPIPHWAKCNQISYRASLGWGNKIKWWVWPLSGSGERFRAFRPSCFNFYTPVNRTKNTLGPGICQGLRGLSTVILPWRCPSRAVDFSPNIAREVADWTVLGVQGLSVGILPENFPMVQGIYSGFTERKISIPLFPAPWVSRNANDRCFRLVFFLPKTIPKSRFLGLFLEGKKCQ